MPRKRHVSDRTVGEVHALFERLVGPGYDNSYARRVLRMPVDGEPLGKRRAELQKSRSLFYAKEYLEAQEAANALVQLDLDETVVNIARRDKPDIAVHWSDRPPVYIEHRIVAEPGMPFERHLEQAQHAFEDLANEDTAVAVRSFLKSGAFTIRISDPGAKARARSGREIAAEAVRLTSEIAGAVSLLKPDPKRYPFLARYAASVFYRPGGPAQTSAFQQNAIAVDPQPPWVQEQLYVALAEKRVAAAGYDPSCRPLWLLLTLQVENLFTDLLRDLIVRTLIGTD